MQSSRISLVAAAAALATGLAWSPAVLAEAGTTPRQAPAETPGVQTPKVSQEKIKSFAEAALEVRRINTEYAPKVEAADSAEAQETIRSEAAGKMVEAVQQKGLSVEEYNQIASAAQSDPEVAREVAKHLRESE